MLTVLCAMSLAVLSAPLVPGSEAPVFRAGKPVWPEGRELKKNLFVGFRAEFERPEKGPVMLRITGATLYRYFVNGEFRGHGPARGPHTYYRVDEWDITESLKSGKNVVAIEVAGYNANSYYVLDQPSFLQAEVVAGDRVLAATGSQEQPFPASILTYRVQKVQRYSFQRPFSEVYRITPGYADWRGDSAAGFSEVSCAETPAKNLLPRRVPYPRFDVVNAVRRICSGVVETDIPLKHVWKDRSLTGVGPKLGGYPEKDLETIPSIELQHVTTVERIEKSELMISDTKIDLSKNSFDIVDLGRNLTGFPRMSVVCETPVRLFVLFDEILRDNDVDWRRLGCVNIVSYELQPGAYTLESFEPYTMRYLKLLALDGAATVTGVGLRTYENPDTARAQFSAADERLNRLFEAGRSTFAQNAVDIFMDCPHRERAGWLCDSFFTARSAMALSGWATVERNFVENFLLPDNFAYLPAGMLPMCYPADHYDGVFIPNWALWFVVQLGEYLERSGDHATVQALQPKVMALFDYFKPFKNEDGLLEKLESWVFVEWSKANNFVQDVNYPSNMLYAGALSTAARLYDRPELEAEAERIRTVIRKQSYDGMFFVDNALRKESGLEVTQNRSEVCQYFAFYFEVASPETYPQLWAVLRDEFGPQRKETKAYEEVHMANSFVGNMLRMELLSQAGLAQQILDESIGYLYYMAERTDTLWENVNDGASLNHGFASHIVHTLQRDVLGVYNVDLAKREITLRFADQKLPWCKGRIPIGDQEVDLEWRQEDGIIRYRLSLPDGYRVTIDNRSGKQLAALTE